MQNDDGRYLAPERELDPEVAVVSAAIDKGHAHSRHTARWHAVGYVLQDDPAHAGACLAPPHRRAVNEIYPLLVVLIRDDDAGESREQESRTARTELDNRLTPAK